MFMNCMNIPIYSRKPVLLVGGRYTHIYSLSLSFFLPTPFSLCASTPLSIAVPNWILFFSLFSSFFFSCVETLILFVVTDLNRSASYRVVVQDHLALGILHVARRSELWLCADYVISAGDSDLGEHHGLWGVFRRLGASHARGQHEWLGRVVADCQVSAERLLHCAAVHVVVHHHLCATRNESCSRALELSSTVSYSI